jgi:hypothetical protein
MAQEVRVDALRLESGLSGELAQDQERPGTRQRSASGVEEELGAVAAVEVWAAARRIPHDRLRGLARDRDDPLLPALAECTHEALVGVDVATLEPDRLAYP